MIETSTKLRVVDHPLVKQSLTRLRDHQTPSNEFRATALRLSRFLVYEAMQDLSVRPVGVETPVGPGEGVVLLLRPRHPRQAVEEQGVVVARRQTP